MRILISIIMAAIATVCIVAEPSAPASNAESVVAQLTAKYDAKLAAQGARIAALEARVAALEMTDGSVAKAPISRSVVESRITSNFEGLDMDKVFILANGQIWRQTEPYIWIYISIMPKVTIYPSDSGVMKMQVEGIRRAVSVERLK